MDFYANFLEEKKKIDAILRDLLKEREEFIYPPLYRAMEYSLFSGGKRIRPVLLKWCAELGTPDPATLNRSIGAIEFIHTYSLVHDDLPDMDNDDTRRGKPTSHKVFGPAMAILAGDGLLTEAFYFSGSAGDSRLTRILAQCSGAEGMVGGQAADIDKYGDKDYIITLKTAYLFKAAALMGGIAGSLDDDKLDKIGVYGINLGKAFQLRDDLLDLEAEGLDETEKKAKMLVEKAKESIASISGTQNLLKLADFVITRKG
ncbi:MAG: polyprenyl synthetase family protein [Elusimicrobia bacterium]|nr:polyprenyl synthetase family protein [Elusimicrobiota bacterium]